MNKCVLVDNDVVWKIACYGIVDKFTAFWKAKQRHIGVLGAARFVLRGVITRSRKIKNKEEASANLEKLLENTEPVEPNQEEILLAARLEEAAIRDKLPLDSGESILFSTLICRSLEFLITGDKRAIGAIEQLTQQLDILAKDRIICFEQMMLFLSEVHGASGMQVAVLREEDIDTVMSICFRCASKVDVTDTLADSLQSYIENIREVAPNVLANGTFD